jgi:hypothetical protein
MNPESMIADLSLFSIDALADLLSNDSLRVESEDALLRRLSNLALPVRALFVTSGLSCSAGKASRLLLTVSCIWIFQNGFGTVLLLCCIVLRRWAR